MSKIALISVFDRNSGTTELVMLRENGDIVSLGFEVSAWNVEKMLRAYDPALSVAVAPRTSKTDFNKTVSNLMNTVFSNA